MFKIADMRSIGRAVHMLCGVVMAGGLSACAHSSLPDPGKPKNWVVANVASKSTAELYADLIAPAVFKRSSSKVINGYTVESGNLLMPDKSEGSLVTVRSADGSVTALINRPGEIGSLHVDNKGVSRFIPEPVVDSHIEDEVTSPNETITTSPVDPASTESHVVDILMGYSRAGVERAGGDAMGDALAKVELVNLALRNSLVSNVSFKLVGIQIVEQEYEVSNETLAKVPTIFAEGIKQFEPDVIYGNFATFVPGGPTGIAYKPGRTGITISNAAMTFAHELGHNAGSDHCNTTGATDYRFGYDNGRSGSLLCGGNRELYYSNPAVKDQYGLPRGNAVTADTARVWRENAERLSSYVHFVPKTPQIVDGLSGYDSVRFKWSLSPRAVKYEIFVRGVLIPTKVGESITTEGVAKGVPRGMWSYFVVAVYADGTKSPRSNYFLAKPYD
ncbi:hypothetical protein POF45_05510 [Pseudomonas sp. 681]|uniref:Uncharacterized protein n=1 Tax=Pseudomonas fungipugnans TaxID=3024217 RepID=A0ABT6QJ78_9PSED|nr:hypothetical protein [Pseudomonas sp. 681]MDI2590893.1 hypothetical protein [Pseudomonas sp. 681]